MTDVTMLQRYRNAVAAFVQARAPVGAPSQCDDELLALFVTNANVATVALDLLGETPPACGCPGCCQGASP